MLKVRVFVITYGSCTQELSREQLMKAPDSLLTKVLLTDEFKTSDTLIIRDDGSSGAWASSSELLFKVNDLFSCTAADSLMVAAPNWKL